MRLQGKVALVAGAGGRQGTAVPLLFAQEGARVVLGGLDADECERLAGLIRERGGEAVARGTDLMYEEEAEAAVRFARETFGRIDILYNNTGVYLAGEKRVHETSLEDWESIINIDIRSHWFCAKHALREMARPRSGSIINIAAARAARLGGNAAYSAAKGGIIAMTKKMAKEYRDDNVRVNCICPTNIQESPSPLDPNAPKRTLLRDGTPEDVAHMGLFLASDEASWITGAAFVVDGGAEVLSW
jgi:NAD(P)-dependent dehydrogenase (short-subunit alcohol dehydrogenase family)